MEFFVGVDGIEDAFGGVEAGDLDDVFVYSLLVYR